MTEQSYNSGSELDSLPNSTIVYRALLRKQWVNRNDGFVQYNAYLLRKNESGLSVRIEGACSPSECAARFRNCYGVASLQVAFIRELGLDVVPDSPSHAQIIGLPSREDDFESAVRLARLLAQQSRLVWQP